MDRDRFFELMTPTTWGGAILGGIGALSVTEWMAVGGFILAVLGFSVNFWHKRQDIKIKREALERDRIAREMQEVQW